MFKDLTDVETRRLLDAKGIDSSRASAFAYLDHDRDIRYHWHAHGRHQLIYAFTGALRLEANHGIFLLPPQRAAWIPAGVSHRTTLHNVLSGSVFFDPALVAGAETGIRIISAPPLISEMVRYALRWPPARQGSDPLADSFFTAMGMMCAEWIKEEMPFRLPAAQTPQIVAAIDHTLGHLNNATLADAAGAAALSERHFRRRFSAETGISWQQFLFQARMLLAMELLARPETSVIEAAFQTGFNSPSAFAKSFRRFTGQVPNRFRRNCLENIGPPAISGS